MTMYLKFTVMENETLFPVSSMSAPESDAIDECVMDLVPKKYKWSSEIWFEADLVLLDDFYDDSDEEPSFGVLRCFKPNPCPKNGSQMESRLPCEFPTDLLSELSGKKFLVEPRQLGLSPWGKKVEVAFEHLPPGKGMKASDLIASALQQQKTSLSPN